ncbi:YgiQ family radical SAM protein [Clostridium sp.]|uniref:YgiQ family radical SAM protein n=1 Tax=Clostridium sp. TaxID=1506 RepID=UPI002FC7D449
MINNEFLPISKQDMIDRGWEQCDFVLVTGDAYIDHHSFGTAIISRVLENAGYKVGIIAQPDWHNIEDFKKLGRPRLGFLVNAGNMDSMVNHYTVSKRLRDKDLYSPGGKMGLRPDRATIVYCNKIREAYKNVNIVIGGIEASLRRFAHYDYWGNNVRNSILVDSGADLLVYGMSEKQIVEVANSLNEGFEAKYIRHINGTCYIIDSLDEVYGDYIVMPSKAEVTEDKVKYAKAFKIQDEEQDPVRGRMLLQKHSDKYVVINKPEMPLTREELDEVYGLPYTKSYHPIYEKDGGIPAIEEVKFSIVSSRGCFGNCNFCAITFHQGRAVQSRSEESILEEAREITELKDFKGYIHDVGGPTANFRKPACKTQLTIGACKHKQCLTPKPCKNMDVDHTEYLHLLRSIRKIPKVKKAFVRSGLRYDYIMADKDDTFFRELVEHHVSGQLKVAPEHVSANALKYMGKPSGQTYDKFREKFFKINKQLGKEQYLIPYLMSSHPGSGLKEAVELAEYLRDTKYQPEQVQDFYPTPGTLSTTMFYTGFDPITMEEIYVPRTKEEKAMQRALLQFKKPHNYKLVHEALMLAGREDLIGNGPKCLIQTQETRYLASLHRSNNKTTTGYKGNSPYKGKKKTKDTKEADKKKERGNQNKGRGKAGNREKFSDDDPRSRAPRKQADGPRYKGKKSRGPARLRLKKK